MPAIHKLQPLNVYRVFHPYGHNDFKDFDSAKEFAERGVSATVFDSETMSSPWERKTVERNYTVTRNGVRHHETHWFITISDTQGKVHTGARIVHRVRVATDK